MKACRDDINWVDDAYGIKCSHMFDDWCQNYGDWSSEAQRYCPVACGVCVNCDSNGNYNAASCSECPQDEAWCNNDCTWNADSSSCVER